MTVVCHWHDLGYGVFLSLRVCRASRCAGSMRFRKFWCAVSVHWFAVASLISCAPRRSGSLWRKGRRGESSKSSVPVKGRMPRT